LAQTNRLAKGSAPTAIISTNELTLASPLDRPIDPLPSEEESAHVDQFSFIVYGDTRGRREGRELQYGHSLVVESILGQIKRRGVTRFPIRFVLHTGDAIVNRRNPKNWNETFIALLNRISTEGRVPYFLAPGNHDITAAHALNNGLTAEAVTNYLRAVADLMPPDGAHRRLEGHPAFAFGYGNSFFIAIDSNLAADKTQLDWVTNQLHNLNRERYQHIFALFHHPPYSSGPHGASVVEATSANIRTHYMPLLRRYRATAVFTGHEHVFEHWVERFEDLNTNDFRMDVIVTGGGGGPPYGYRGEPRLTDYLNAGAAERLTVEHLVRPRQRPADNPHHFLIVTVDKDNTTFEVIAVDATAEFRPYTSNKLSLD
jgi:3',5'-cyclic AMP phosphodiesterase CpdA